MDIMIDNAEIYGRYCLKSTFFQQGLPLSLSISFQKVFALKERQDLPRGSERRALSIPCSYSTSVAALKPLGKHYQCYSVTVWGLQSGVPPLLLDCHPSGSLSFEGGTLDTQHHFSAPIAYNLICYTSFATTTYQHRTSV